MKMETILETNGRTISLNAVSKIEKSLSLLLSSLRDVGSVQRDGKFPELYCRTRSEGRNWVSRAMNVYGQLSEDVENRVRILYTRNRK